MNIMCAIFGHNETKRTVLYSDLFLRDFEDNGDSFTVWFGVTSEEWVFEGCSRCDSNPSGRVKTEIGLVMSLVFDTERVCQIELDPIKGFTGTVESLVFTGQTSLPTGTVDILWDGYSDELDDWRKMHDDLKGARDEEFGMGFSLDEVKLDIACKLNNSINARIAHYLSFRKQQNA